MTFSLAHVPFFALMWILARKKKESKKMLGYFVAGIAIANAHCNYSLFLVDQEKIANQTVVWLIGLIGMLAFCPILFKPKDANKSCEETS